MSNKHTRTLEKLEPGVRLGTNPERFDENLRDTAIVSMAISAKRQADALERIANALTGDEKNSGLIFMLDQIAIGVQSR